MDFNQFLQMTLWLIAIIPLIIITVYIIKRYTGHLSPIHGQAMQIMQSLNLGGKDKIVLIKHGNCELILGVSAHGINLLKITEQV